MIKNLTLVNGDERHENILTVPIFQHPHLKKAYTDPGEIFSSQRNNYSSKAKVTEIQNNGAWSGYSN